MPRTAVQGLAFLLGFWIALVLSPFTVRVARGADNGAPSAALEARLHHGINAERERHHLIPLVRDAALDTVARAHAEDMARRGYLSHVNPEGANPLDRIQAAGISGFTLAAENAGLTERAEPAEEILRHWIASPVHAHNLYAPPFNRTGIGFARAANGTWYVAQLYLTVPQ